jgi:indole-3-glycerol phosphate synthase
MARKSRLRAERLRERRAQIESACAAAPVPVRLLPSGGGFDVIAEAKLASPSEGVLAAGGADTVIRLAQSYADGGAAAISVLTEPDSFGGKPEHLERVASGFALPVMRKDFLVDPLQVLEARALGASGVLLIARILDASSLREMTELALELDMFVLVEVFEVSDVSLAGVVFDRPVLIGVNGRDLETLRVDEERHRALARLLPSDHALVAESGVSTPAQIEAIVGFGYSMALIGSALATAEEPADLLRQLLAAGREAAVGAGR